MASELASEPPEVLPREGTVATRSRCGFQLTAADVDMIRRVFEYRFLRIDHLCALTKRSYKKVHGRLLKLARNRFLSRIELPFQKHIYVLGREGIVVLVEWGIAARELIDWRLRHQELKELFLRHQLMLVDLHCMLELACRGTSVRLVRWREGNELWDRVTTWKNRERANLPVCPDAFFVLEDSSRPAGRNRLNFLLEADRSTSTHKRFQQKLVAYQEYMAAGLHAKKYGIRTFRVVTVTLTDARARSLAAAARDVLPSGILRHFLFASIEHLCLTEPEAVLSEQFLTPGEEEGSEVRVRLVPVD